MKAKLIALFFLVVCDHAFTQTTPRIMLGNSVDRHPRGFVTTLPAPPPGVSGSSYLYEDWNKSTILLTDGKAIEDIPVKIDLQSMVIEISHNNEVKVLPFSRVKELDLFLSNGLVQHFVNGRSFNFKGTRIEGLFSFVKHGKYNLLSLTQAVKEAGVYNAALDVGSRDFTIVKRKSYFVMKDNQVVPVGKSRKKFRADLERTFGEDFETRLLKVKTSKEESLAAFVSSLNGETL